LNNVDNTLIIVDSQPPSLEVERLDPISQAITSWVHSRCSYQIRGIIQEAPMKPFWGA
jgi:hypothetical protein